MSQVWLGCHCYFCVQKQGSKVLAVTAATLRLISAELNGSGACSIFLCFTLQFPVSFTMSDFYCSDQKGVLHGPNIKRLLHFVYHPFFPEGPELCVSQTPTTRLCGWLFSDFLFSNGTLCDLSSHDFEPRFFFVQVCSLNLPVNFAAGLAPGFTLS